MSMIVDAMSRRRPTMSANQLLWLVAGYLMLTANHAFVNNVITVYPLAEGNVLFVASVILSFTAATTLLLGILCIRPVLRPMLIILLFIAAAVAYFMDSYNVIVDADMLDNAVQTDAAETLDLISFRLGLYLLGIGLLPSAFVLWVRLKPQTLRRAFLTRLRLLGISLGIIALCIAPLSSYYTSFFRAHKTLRYYANPSFPVYSIVKYAGRLFDSGPAELQGRGLNARIPATDTDRELVIMVVGETARADHFSLNGYFRDTNPLLAKEKVVSLTNMWSCGTSTGVSVPCMFSELTADDYEAGRALSTENVLDIVEHSGGHVLWRDNNSDSKGVALRVEYESFRSPELNPVCDSECRDEGMLSGLQDWVDSNPGGDLMIVLHQMGNHGPAYYKRYPPEFEWFTPVCRSNQLEQCSSEELSNAYDNAILYTDYFLSRVIGFLKSNDSGFETAMLYVSDHGESLGENGIYLHGLPSMVAPDNQRHVASIVWFGKHFDAATTEAVEARRNQRFSHDNLFHTLLALLEIETPEYDPALSLISSEAHD